VQTRVHVLACGAQQQSERLVRVPGSPLPEHAIADWCYFHFLAHPEPLQPRQPQRAGLCVQAIRRAQRLRRGEQRQSAQRGQGGCIALA